MVSSTSNNTVCISSKWLQKKQVIAKKRGACSSRASPLPFLNLPLTILKYTKSLELLFPLYVIIYDGELSEGIMIMFIVNNESFLCNIRGRTFYSLLVTRYFLVVTLYFLLFTRYPLLLTRYSLILIRHYLFVTQYFLLVTFVH